MIKFFLARRGFWFVHIISPTQMIKSFSLAAGRIILLNRKRTAVSAALLYGVLACAYNLARYKC